MSYLVSVIKRRSYTYIKEKCWPSLNLNVKLKSLHVLNLEVSVRSDEKVLWEWVFPGTIFLRTLTATHLSAVTTPRLSSLENRQALPANSLCQVFCASSLCQLLFLTSRFVFRFFLSLYLNIYLVACCIVDYWECLTNVQAPDFKESSHNTHSLILISEPRKSTVSYTTNSSQEEGV